MHRLAFAVVTAIGALLAATPAIAQAYPSRPITMIVPWPAGGSSDVVARATAEIAAKILGQPILIDNKAGASGTLGPATMVATAKPDGYTISQLPISVMRLPLMQKTTWDPLKDITYIIQQTGYTFGVTTKADGPLKSWADVIKFAKENPGKVSYGSPGVGSSLHIGMEQIAKHSGVVFTHVPFKGGAETSAAVIGGHTTLQADSTSWKPIVDGGQARLLNLWTAERSKVWPDVPTLKELGYPFVFDSPFGIGGPKGMDPAVVKKLHDAFKAAFDDPGVLELFKKYDMSVRYLGSEDYAKAAAAFIESERVALGNIGLLKKD